MNKIVYLITSFFERNRKYVNSSNTLRRKREKKIKKYIENKKRETKKTSRTSLFSSSSIFMAGTSRDAFPPGVIGATGKSKE